MPLTSSIFCAGKPEAVSPKLTADASAGPRPSLGPNTRVAVVAPYLFIYDYTLDDDTLTLLRILHGRRNVSRALLAR